MTCPRCSTNLTFLLEYVKENRFQEYEYFYNKYFHQVEKSSWLIHKSREIYCNNRGIYVVDHSADLNHTLELLNLSLGQYIYQKEFLIESEDYRLLPCLYHLNKEERYRFFVNKSNNGRNNQVMEMFIELRKEHGMRESCEIISNRIGHKKTWQTIRRLVYSR